MSAAVLVIDVQAVLFDAHPAPFEGPEVVQRINQLTEWARTQGLPVLFIQHEKADTGIAYQSPGWQLQAGLRVQEQDQRIRKTTPDSFLQTDLEESLRRQGIDEVLVCGYASEFCVDTTVRRAAALGFTVKLVADAHTTVDKPHASGAQIRQHHNASLSCISSFSGKISAPTLAEIMQG
ncbi:cysteine hydrolase family protein [Balneatrix alpica]|uniref:cysteine hydrolase family protein n=1 Tax=Balneatrix alpica TaxID=75684 RepID=UPI00273903BA|nr:cysteine hydrolase family protein [Balneatrix alpica]